VRAGGGCGLSCGGTGPVPCGRPERSAGGGAPGSAQQGQCGSRRQVLVRAGAGHGLNPGGRPVPAGTVRDGRPALVHGKHINEPPVVPMPSGAGPVAAGAIQTSKDASSWAGTSRTVQVPARARPDRPRRGTREAARVGVPPAGARPHGAGARLPGRSGAGNSWRHLVPGPAPTARRVRHCGPAPDRSPPRSPGSTACPHQLRGGTPLLARDRRAPQRTAPAARGALPGARASP
jgi:hypothetical protein